MQCNGGCRPRGRRQRCHLSEDTTLHYALPEFGVKMPFKPTDFTQVNHHINRVMVARALRLLDVQANERVADLFCGLGNFTLPIATQAREVVGIEGSTALTERALENAKANGLAEKTQFLCRNLFEATTEDFMALGKFDRLLIDPPRDGAIAVCQAQLIGLRQSHPELMPNVSCMWLVVLLPWPVMPDCWCRKAATH